MLRRQTVTLLGGTFTVSVTADVFEMKTEQLMVSVRCCVSYQYVSSLAQQQLASNVVTSAKSREHGYCI